MESKYMLKIKNLCQNLSIEEFQIVKHRLDIVFHVFPTYAFSLFFFSGKSAFLKLYVTLVSPVYCSRDPQISFFNNFSIKKGSHSTIYTFKNYFATVVSVFNGIQTGLKCAFGLELKRKIISLFSLFLLLFMGLTTLFDTIHGVHCTISTNFYFYLQYFQQ